MIVVEVSQGIGRIRIDRADKKNAFNGQMLSDIEAAIARLGSDPACRVVVLESVGDTFCSGADLAWMAAQSQGGHAANVKGAKDLGHTFHCISKSKKPVIGRIQGAARGGGVGLAAAVDIAVASERASFALTEVRLGLIPAVISPFVVERLGPSRARALFLTGETIDAAEAWRVGLIHHCVPHEQLDQKVQQVAELLAQGGPEALLGCKHLVDLVAFQPAEAVFEQTAQAIAERRASAEAQEGMTAFLQKRKASWIP